MKMRNLRESGAIFLSDDHVGRVVEISLKFEVPGARLPYGRFSMLFNEGELRQWPMPSIGEFEEAPVPLPAGYSVAEFRHGMQSYYWIGDTSLAVEHLPEQAQVTGLVEHDLTWQDSGGPEADGLEVALAPGLWLRLIARPEAGDA